MSKTTYAGYLVLPLLLIAALGGAGCRRYSVHTDYHRQADFHKYKSFSWLPPATGVAPEEARSGSGVTTILGSQIKQAVHESLTAKGLQAAALGDADLWVTYRLVTRREPWVMPFPYLEWRWGAFTAQEPMYVSYYRSSALILSVIDAHAKQVVWQAEAIDLRHQWEQINRVVSEMLEAFPPGPKQTFFAPEGV